MPRPPPPPPNRFRELDLEQLDKVAEDLLRRLDAPGPHSAESRQQLALDLRHYIASSRGWLDPSPYAPGHPEAALRMGSAGTVAEAFGTFFRAHAHGLRSLAMTRAASYVIGPGFDKYLRSGGVDADQHGWRATLSDEHLMDELRKLDQLPPPKNRKTR